MTLISDADTEVQRRLHLVRVRAALLLTYKKPFFPTSHHYPRSKFCKMTPDMQPWGRWSFMPIYTVPIKLNQLCWKAGFNCSVAKSCLTLCGPLDCSTPSSAVLHCLPEFAQTHVHWVSDAIQPYHPPSSAFPSAFNIFQHQGLFQWVGSSHQVAKVLELQHQYFQWIFRVGFL